MTNTCTVTDHVTPSFPQQDACKLRRPGALWPQDSWYLIKFQLQSISCTMFSLIPTKNRPWPESKDSLKTSRPNYVLPDPNGTSKVKLSDGKKILHSSQNRILLLFQIHPCFISNIQFTFACKLKIRIYA